MDKDQIMSDAFNKFKGSLDKNTCMSSMDYFKAGWDACESVWTLGEPNKDLMISELEGELECVKNKNYEKEYISLYKRSTRYLGILAQISTTQGNDKLSETEKLEHIRKLLDKVSTSKEL